MSEVTMGPHEPRDGNFWTRMGWNDEREYEESLVAPCGSCGSVEVLDDHRDRKLCHDCWWKARESEPCFFLKSITGSLYLGGHIPTGYTREEADERVKDFEPREYEVVSGAWEGSGRVAHNGYMNRRRRTIDWDMEESDDAQ